MKQPSASSPSDDLESAAGAFVGKIVFAFSRLELNLSLCLHSAVAGSSVDLVNPIIERLTFKHKLDALLEVVQLKFAESPICVSEFKAWHRGMDTLRTKRNSFVHGRWGFLHNAQEVINVAPGMPSSVPLREIRYTLAELEAELVAVQLATEQLSSLRQKWHL